MLTNLLSDSLKPLVDTNILTVEISFWPFIRNFMNKFDVNRYECLPNIKTDTGRQRAWLRSCLNEHSLERFLLAIIANETLVNQYYEEWSFLADRELAKTWPTLCQGLQSVLFAINIDNPNFNQPNKISNSSTTTTTSNGQNSPTSANSSPSLAPKSNLSTESPSSPSKLKPSDQLKSAKSSSSSAAQRKTKKPNQIILEDDQRKQENILDSLTIRNKQKSKSSPNKIVEEEIFGLGDNEEAISWNESTNQIKQQQQLQQQQSDEEKPLSILTNPICLKKPTTTSTSSSSNPSSPPLSAESNLNKIADHADSSPKSNSDVAVKDDDDQPSRIGEPMKRPSDESTSMIPINTYVSQSNFSLSSSTISESSTYKYMAIVDKDSAEMTMSEKQSSSIYFDLAPSSSNAKQTIQEDNHSIEELNLDDSSDVKRMKELALSLYKAKLDLESANKNMASLLDAEKSRSKSLEDHLLLMESDLNQTKSTLNLKISLLDNENKLLREQLKKYMSAFQLLQKKKKSSRDDESINKSPQSPSSDSLDLNRSLDARELIDELNKQEKEQDEARMSNLRDYSYEAEQYEKKLIQVAEMHGELMEFNSKLTRLLNIKNIQLEKLKEELIELRGPVIIL